jgi:hypothetical protein
MYVLGGIATFVYLTFFEDYRYTSRNWIIAVPLNAFLALIWPIYWSTLRPVLAP